MAFQTRNNVGQDLILFIGNWLLWFAISGSPVSDSKHIIRERRCHSKREGKSFWLKITRHVNLKKIFTDN